MKGYKAAIMAIMTFIATHVYASHIDDNTALQLAPTGDVDAQAQLANSYLMGTNHIQINYQQAKYWAEKAYAQGNHRAELVLGILYLNGYAVQQDYAKARQLFEQANQAGEMKAARYLGLIYLNGWGVAANDEKAAQYFQIGDQHNDISSQYQLAKLYEQGKGVVQNYSQAIELYKKNNDRVDHITAPNFIALSRIYEQGLGVTKDPKQACYWYQKALQAEPKLAIQQKITC